MQLIIIIKILFYRKCEQTRDFITQECLHFSSEIETWVLNIYSHNLKIGMYLQSADDNVVFLFLDDNSYKQNFYKMRDFYKSTWQQLDENCRFDTSFFTFTTHHLVFTDFGIQLQNQLICFTYAKSKINSDIYCWIESIIVQIIHS